MRQAIYNEGFPAWVECVGTRRTKRGNWAVIVRGNTWGRVNHIEATYYLDGSLPERHAINSAVNSARKIKRASKRAWIIHQLRVVRGGDQQQYRPLSDELKATFGVGFLDIDKGQDEVIRRLNLPSFEAESFKGVEVRA